MKVCFTSVNHPKDKVEYDSPIERTLRYSVKEILFFVVELEVECLEGEKVRKHRFLH